MILDPPYKTDFGRTSIDYIVNNNLLNPNGIIIFETSDNIDFDFNYDGFEIKRKKYGTVAVYKLEKVN